MVLAFIIFLLLAILLIVAISTFIRYMIEDFIEERKKKRNEQIDT